MNHFLCHITVAAVAALIILVPTTAAQRKSTSLVAHGALTSGDTSMALPAGLYVVRVGQMSGKVAIK